MNRQAAYFIRCNSSLSLPRFLSRSLSFCFHFHLPLSLVLILFPSLFAQNLFLPCEPEHTNNKQKKSCRMWSNTSSGRLKRKSCGLKFRRFSLSRPERDSYAPYYQHHQRTLNYAITKSTQTLAFINMVRISSVYTSGLIVRIDVWFIYL